MSPPPAPDRCIFCDIVARRAPGHIFYEDDAAVAFLDLFPLTRGHALLVPRHHVDRLTDLPPVEYPGLLGALTNVCRRMERLSTHYNVGVNQGALAGQIVFHLHFHIIPRYDERNPFRSHPRERVEDADALALVAQLTAA